MLTESEQRHRTAKQHGSLQPLHGALHTATRTGMARGSGVCCVGPCRTGAAAPIRMQGSML